MDDPSKQPAASPESRHPIKVVALRTGLSADVIRVWERRYHAVLPARAGGRRRLYSDADIERLSLLRRGTLSGRRISDLAPLTDEDLLALVDDDDRSRGRRADPGSSAPLTEDSPSALAAAKQAVRDLDPHVLSMKIARAGVDFSPPHLLSELIVPLIDWIGEAWRSGEIRIVHEHAATSVIAASLQGMLGERRASLGAPELVAGTPRGHRHELGALLAALTAASEGWRVCYLGTDLPIDEIAAAVVQRDARAVALSLVYPADDPELAQELKRLREAIGDKVQLFAGGRAFPAYASALEAVRGRRVDDFGAFRLELEALRFRPVTPELPD